MRLRDLVPVLLVVGGILQGCGIEDLCGNELITRVSSPTGKHLAIVFERDCGATTGFSTQVSIFEQGEMFRERSSWLHATVAGNALSIDDDHGAAPPGPCGGPTVVVQWTDETHVTLTYHVRARVFLAPNRVGEVTVRHVRTR